MFGSRRRQLPHLPFTVTALQQGFEPIRIGIIATSKSNAMLTAQELFPSHIIGIAELEPQWQDGPA